MLRVSHSAEIVLTSIGSDVVILGHVGATVRLKVVPVPRLYFVLAEDTLNGVAYDSHSFTVHTLMELPELGLILSSLSHTVYPYFLNLAATACP